MSVGSRQGRSPRPWFFVAVMITGIALGCQCAHAGSIVQIGGGSASSVSGLGSFSGSISYTADSAFSTTGTLVISLTNTSSAANGGFITGLLFNIGSGDGDSSASLVSASNSFIDCTGNGLNGAPYGDFDSGAAIGGNFLGGGNPNPGIALGATGVFTFAINADDAGGLTAMDFLSGGAFGFNFLVRFRGFEDGGSDKVGAVIVPLPAALAMGLAGLGALGVLGASRALKRRRGIKYQRT